MSENLRVTEIYHSIQGESTWAGMPCTFVRLARCHLRCVWCDTAYSFYGGTSTPIDDIVAQCEAHDCTLVEITGGEPLVQPGCVFLCERLIDKGFKVLVETSGTLPIAPLPADVIKIMDLKCPDSGECDKNDYENIEHLSMQDEVKFVIASRRDYEWARDKQWEYRLALRCNAVLFSPVFGSIDPKDIVNWIIEDNLLVRLQLQMHKFIWPPDMKGV